MEAALRAVEQEVTKISGNVSERRSPGHFRESLNRLKICLNFLQTNFPPSDRTKSIEKVIEVLITVCTAKHVPDAEQDDYERFSSNEDRRVST